MQVTSLLSQNPGTEAEGRPAGPNLTVAFLGLIGIANAYLIGWTWSKGTEIAALSALAGSLLLGFPLLASSWASLRRGEVGINELVSLAFLAAFATGDYRTAGLVAFFMLLGEVLESRGSPPTGRKRRFPPARSGPPTSSGCGRATTFRRTASSNGAPPPSTRPISPANRCPWTAAKARRCLPVPPTSPV
jgi:hypothetical protein